MLDNTPPQPAYSASVPPEAGLNHAAYSGISQTYDPSLTISYNNPSPHGSTTSSALQNVDLATARWFEMFAGDADLDLGALPLLDNVHYDTVPSSTHAQMYTQDSQAQMATGDPPTTALSPSAARTLHGTSRTSNVSHDGVLHTTTEDMYWRSQEALRLQPLESFLFQHFVHSISRWLDLFDPHRHFSTVVPRMAVHNIGLLYAILSLSARHLSLNPDLSMEHSFTRRDAIEYYHQSLGYIHKAMQYKSYNTSMEHLSTTLMISAYEMLDGSSREWERHLQGVFWIQRSLVNHGDSGGLKAAIWWSWLCQDIWAAFREKRAVFTFWQPQRTFADLDSWELAARSLLNFARVVDYCSRVHLQDANFTVAQSVQAADKLLATLDDWSQHRGAEFLPLPYTTETSDSFFAPIWIHPEPFGKMPAVSHARCRD